MARLNRLLASTVVAGSVICSVVADAQPVRPGVDSPVQMAAARPGRLDGLVTDDRGRALPGAAVTVQGIQVLFAMTDGRGRFTLEGLNPGAYLVRATLPGYVASKRALVEVMPQRAVYQHFRLSALSSEASVPRVLAAAMSAADAADDPASAAADASDNHSAAAWRVRHLKRSVLREAGHAAPGDATDDAQFDAQQNLAADIAASVVSGWRQLAGEVQLLTSSSFDSPQELFSTTERSPHQIAYVEIGSESGSRIQWQIQGALTQGDLSSWVLGGSYRQAVFEGHVLNAGLSYGTQSYVGGNPVALAAVGDGDRNAGSLFAFDEWSVRPDVTLTLGARYARYAYLEDPGLFSPSVSLHWRPSPRNAVRMALGQQMVAPGAEEFVPSNFSGMWMPPQRTFAPVNPKQGFRAERSRHAELVVEHQFAAFTMSARGFRQGVENQLVTLFGVRVSEAPRTDIGHYFTGSAGDVVAYGWGVGVSRDIASRVRGSIDYTVTHASWGNGGEALLLRAVPRPGLGRSGAERLHDLTTVVETVFPETATRVFAAYKLNSGYSRSDLEADETGPDGRFDVQVNQRLPFLGFTNAEWEVLFAVRTLFRDQLDSASVFDELLVVRPPKRILGGLLVRF